MLGIPPRNQRVTFPSSTFCPLLGSAAVQWTKNAIPMAKERVWILSHWFAVFRENLSPDELVEFGQSPWISLTVEPCGVRQLRVIWSEADLRSISESRLEYCLFREFADLFLIVLPFGRSLALLIAVFLSTHRKPRMFRLITKQRCKPGRRGDSEV